MGGGGEEGLGQGHQRMNKTRIKEEARTKHMETNGSCRNKVHKGRTKAKSFLKRIHKPQHWNKQSAEEKGKQNH